MTRRRKVWKSLSTIFNKELQVGVQEIYTQIISTLADLGITDDMNQITRQNITNMVINIYNKTPDCNFFLWIHVHLFIFFREYKAKIIRDLRLFRDGKKVMFRVRLRDR
ncbi:uncharacterized protein LOC123267587 [Cotesia glomerata]|uniref:uncharacterized protein LOC123267587 n=1 Tax=Cotesia glomerata TaxID=32391 RepID=UPI001D01F5E8|nr:uncharacterized protein LOC123267587 [Cotesia glomerata]